MREDGGEVGEEVSVGGGEGKVGTVEGAGWGCRSESLARLRRGGGS